MIRKVLSGCFLICLLINLPACSEKANTSSPVEKTAVNPSPEKKSAARPPVAVEVARADTVDFTDGIDVVGSLSPKFSAHVKSEYAGIATEVYVNEWVRVRKGMPLVRIDSREMEILQQKAGAAVEMARANVLQAEVAANRAEREYDRLQKLKEHGLATQQGLDEGFTEKEATTARVAGARAQLRAAEEDLQHTRTRLSKTLIRSPVDGIVAYRGVNVGDMVGEMGSSKIMFRIIDPRILELTVNVPSWQMGSVRVGQPLLFSIDSLPGRKVTGTVMFINPVVNESDRSVKVVAEVDNSSELLKGGLFVEGRIITGKRTGLLRVPRVALLTWDVVGKKGDVFVVQGEVATRRAVQTGSVMDDFVEVTSGLSPEEQVVVRGGFNLKDGDRVSITSPKGN